ncbi:SCAN domain-containing protein 3-like [Linepithema humile]|uniref:SCAN domain-containing protein 3-like n=1 Tax=Linepithema humile TaxID=83485 RepID=UPI00351E3BC9
MDSSMHDINNKKKGAVKKRTIRNFNLSWLDEDCFKGWLAPHPEKNKALCVVCNKTIRCCKTNLTQHSQTETHLTNIKPQNQSLNHNYNERVLHKNKVKRAEIKLAAFFAEHNIAFCTADHLIPLLKDICIEPEVTQNLSLKYTKCTKIVENVIAKREVEKLVEILQIRKFSILIDESTDITDTKFMCLLVKFISPTDKKIKTQLLELLALDATNCTASNIFKTFKIFLNKKNIPIKNIVGMASDNASVMTGCNNSFFSHLKTEVPGVVLLNCICHSSAIVASKACEKLPKRCENLIRNVSTYISGSAKRCAILGEFQKFFNVEKKKLLKLSNTRWLVLHNCVIRLLENWEVLKNYFLVAVVEDKSQSAEAILAQLNDESIKAYLLFLKYSLHFFNNFNILFQSRKILIHKLYNSSQQIIHQIAQNFMVPEALKDIVTLNVDDERNIKHLLDIYVGPDCESFLVNQPLVFVQDIKLTCLNFYITALKEMLKRLPYKNSFFKQLTFLDAKIALYDEGRNEIKDLSIIASHFENIDITKLGFEWRILPTVINDTEKIELALLEVDEMWQKIFHYKDFNEEKMFPNLELLVESVLTFPHSNAEAERIFSIVTDVKNKKRNSLSDSITSAICTIRSSFQADNINCISFKVDDRHLELHNAQNLYSKHKSDSA